MSVKEYRAKDYPKENNSWSKMKERCTNENHDSYHKYGAKGITVSEALASSFQSFMECVGPMPKDGQRYSIDRIDGRKGYEEGNLRWATDSQQSQNRQKRITNTSGVIGVYKEEGRWAAEIWDMNSKRLRKRFSIKKYGEELAFFLAVEQRRQWVDVLNQMGCYYPTEYD